MTAITVPSLVETDWLQQHLLEPQMRVLDCTVFLEINPDTGERKAESGRSEWEKAHIPGSVFADILNDLSETDNPQFPMQMPTAEKFAVSMGELGVGDDTAVVLYDSRGNMWAARVWWMLRAFGFENAGVLNGGWSKWVAEDRPISSETTKVTPATFTPKPRPELIASKQDVLQEIDQGGSCILNALSPDDFNNARIPSSTNVPAVGGAVDPETMTYRPPKSLRQLFSDAGAMDDRRVITYCGGGIAASSAAFALHLIGKDNVAVYDGSMSEWTSDPDLPLERG